jgi:hypothetical protein
MLRQIRGAGSIREAGEQLDLFLCSGGSSSKIIGHNYLPLYSRGYSMKVTTR